MIGTRIALALAGVLLLTAFFAREELTPAQAGVLKRQGDLTAGFGINLHKVTPEAVQAIAALGARTVRIDLLWDRVETSPGQYDWSSPDRRIGAIAAAGLRPLVILDYSNPNYAQPTAVGSGRWNAPTDARGRGAFAALARAAAERYRRYDPIWELWNEPDANGFWPPKSDPAQYAQLALAACQSIRGAVPEARIWGPALSTIPTPSAVDSPYLKSVLASPLPACLSAISLHPYRHWSQVDAIPQYWHDVQGLPTSTKRPFVSSESGISSYKGWIRPETQASYLVRMLIYDRMAGVDTTIWYDWQNDGPDPNAALDNFGLVDIDGKTKPALLAAKQLTSATRGLDRQCLVQNRWMTYLYAWNAQSPEDRLLIVWRRTLGLPGDENGSIAVDLPSGVRTAQARDLLGKPADLRRTSTTGPWQTGSGLMPFYVSYTGALPGDCA